MPSNQDVPPLRLRQAVSPDEDRATMPASLAEEVREALEGDSNDAEHDALVSVAEQFGTDNFTTE